jgi:hypothetical protein
MAADRMPRAARSNNWQDWANLILGIWLSVSPWVLEFGSHAPPLTAAAGAVDPAAGALTAAWNAWVLGTIVALVSASAISRMEFWQERLNLVLAIWIFVAPWVLDFALLPEASWNHRVVGVLVFLISLSLLTRRVPQSG